MMSQKKYILILAGCILLLGIMSFGLPAEAFADSSCAFTPRNETTGDNVGYTGNGEMTAQPFTVASTCYPTDISFHMKTVGTPVDDLTYSIYDDNSGEPGTQLAVTPAVAGITGTYAWATSTLTTSITLSPATTYWLVFSRSGSLSTVNYWMVFISDNIPTYSAGANKGYMKFYDAIWNGGGNHNTWFQLYGGSAPGGGFESTDWGGATSTIEQSQTNLFYGFFVFFVSFFGVVWLFRKNV